MKQQIKRILALLLCLMLVSGLAACGGSAGETEASSGAEVSTAQSTAAETRQTVPEPETKALTEAERREAVLTAAGASAAKSELERLQDAAKAIGADLSAVTTGEELMRSGQLAIFPEIGTEAPDSLTEMFDWMTADWEGGYAKLQKDLITPEKREERLNSYNEFNNTRKIIEYYNTPQQVLRAYAKAQPGDLLLGVLPTKDSTRIKIAGVIVKAEPVFLADGINVDPRESRFTLIGADGKEKELLFQLAFATYFALPYRFTAMGEGQAAAPQTAEKAKLPENPVLQIGFGRADITSELKIPLAGYGNTASRQSNKTLTPEDRLTATAIAMSDGSNTELLFTMDTIRVPTGWSDKAAEAIEQATGIPASHIGFSCTHTHSGPDIGDEESADQPAKAITSGLPYFQVWKQGLVDAAAEAIKDLAPVKETGAAVTVLEKLNCIRHWRTDGGRMEGVNFNTGANLGAAETADDRLQLIRFAREGRKDVVLVNWQAHNNAASTSGTDYGTAARPYISADYAGYMRRYIENQDEDCLVAFFLGASGDVLPRGTEAAVKPHNINQADRYGERLGQAALAAMKNLTVVETGAVQGMQEQHVAFDDGYVGTVREIEQNVITIGGSLAFVTAGYEMFNVSGMDTKERSPFTMTFVCTCGQGHEYMPSFRAHHYYILDEKQEKAYEAKGGQCNVAPGTAEDLVDGLIGMLESLKNNLDKKTEKQILEPVSGEPAENESTPSQPGAQKDLAQGSALSYTYKRITSDKYDPGLLIDGGLETALVSAAGWNFTAGGEIRLDLGSVRRLSGYTLTPYGNPTVYGGIKSWKLSVSADGESWTALDQAADNSGSEVRKDFPEGTEARYVKLEVTDAWENTKLGDNVTDKRVIRITELEIWGE